MAVPSESIMHRLPLPTFFRWAVLTGYALLVALGHGGWHVVVDRHGCPAHGPHGDGAKPQAEVVHSHATCSHGHKHKLSGKHSHESHNHNDPVKHSPTHHEPHDSEHCSVCAVFSAPQTLVTAVELTFTISEVNSRIDWQAVLMPVSHESLPTLRGPPAC
jgi:hypothetical protein